ncbi:MAG: FHA domain-containing protein [Myxococcales bacterium]|nr:FHA domain-containing protein [Myxococcales bacterium]
MRLCIRGVPRNSEPCWLDPGDSGALLGRMEGDNPNGLRIPIPHIESPAQGEPKTDSLSRQHLRFDFQNGAWYVTWLGRQPTLLNDAELAAQKPTRLPPEATLRSGELSLHLSIEDPFATRAIRPGPSTPPQPADKYRTRVFPSKGAVIPEAMEPISVDSLTGQTKTMLDQMLAELDRVTTATQDLQQKRALSEQAREEAKVAIAAVRQAVSLPQLQAAAERVRDAALRSRQASEKTATLGDTVRRAVERSREIERALKSMASDAARAMLRLSPTDPSGRALSAQMSHSEEEARRRLAEVDEHSQRALAEREKAQAAAKMAAEVEEEALALASHRESEFRQKERFLALFRRYGVLLLILLAAIGLGLLIAQILESGPEPLSEGLGLVLSLAPRGPTRRTPLRRIQLQQRP